MNFIEELYYGHINPNVKDSVATVRHQQAADIVLRISTQLKETLPEPERTLLEHLLEAEDEIIEEKCLSDFKLGFSLGLHMMIDSFAVSPF